MATITIHVDDILENKLGTRAATHGRSIENEAREILRTVLLTEMPHSRNLGRVIHDRFAALGGVDVPDVPREIIRPIS